MVGGKATLVVFMMVLMMAMMLFLVDGDGEDDCEDPRNNDSDGERMS